MPKKLKFFLCVCLLFATIATPVAGYLYDNPLSFTNSTAANYEADKLNSLGLFLGTSSGYDLWRVSTRAEGLVMLIRLMGEEAKAKECAYTHPFQDVPAWADRYVAWAYAKGYTKGTSATTFTPNSNISSGEYITFMLRALGYGDGATPQNAVARAVEVGLIHEGMYTLNLPFWRADMVRVSYLAMTTIENTTKKPLFEVLIDRGAVDAEKARTLFQPLPQKLYSITGLRNHRLNIEASISGDNIVISGTHAMDDLVSIVILIQETPDTDTYWYKQTVLYDEIVWPDNSFRLYAPIPNPTTPKNLELEVRVENESAVSRAIDRVWLRKDADGWYFTTPDAMRWNRDVTEPADARPLEYWLSRRKTVTESFQKQILSLMGPAKESDYETAYSVYTWITQNITYSQNNVVANSQWVLDNRVAKCDGYSTLMVDALAVYGIPARIAVGQRITHFDKFGTFVDIFDLNHAWVEFYDSRSDRWVIVDPTWGCNVPECQFDIDRTNAANVMKIAYYE